MTRRSGGGRKRLQDIMGQVDSQTGRQRRELIDKFGSDTVKMVGNIIPVLAEPYGRGRYTINVDVKEMMKKQIP